MDTTSQEVSENIDTDESSNSSLSVQDEVSMQDIRRSVDIEEVQNITDDNLYDDIDVDFLPRERISRYTTKLSANFDVNDFERPESEYEQSADNDSDSDDSVDNGDNGPHEIFEDYSCPPFNLLFQDANASGTNQNN